MEDNFDVKAINAIKELTYKLNYYADQYYNHDTSVVSDKTYDALYDELENLEKENNFRLSNSPTVKVQGKVIDKFTKITHTQPMLSAAKTKDAAEVTKWINNRPYYASAKADGLTIVLRYSQGKLVQAITRGDGIVGEDVTEQAKMIQNLPLEISYSGDLELRGECVITWFNFNQINKKLTVPYSHPRNLASGTLRQLNTNIVKERKLNVYIFDVITDIGIDDKIETLLAMNVLGFQIIPFTYDNKKGVEADLEMLKADNLELPVDGVVFTLRSRKQGIETGSTTHHPNNLLAYKWANDTYETVLRDIQWQVSRNGTLSPVAVFDPVDLGGAVTTKATLHNLSILESYKFGIGDTITVYRSNEVIPAIDENLTQSGTYKAPTVCPQCGKPLTVYTSDTNTKVLRCTNKSCFGQILRQLTHFVSKHAMNIDGLSEKTIEMLFNHEYISNILDIYSIKNCKEIQNENGFGEKSYIKLCQSIEKSKSTTLNRLIYALGIDGIGRKAAITIADKAETLSGFMKLCQDDFDFTQLDDFGTETAQNIKDWYNDDNKKLLKSLMEILGDVACDKKSTVLANNTVLNNLSFVITGTLNNYSRNDLINKIEKLGGKVTGSVTSKTNYLINNDINSTSSKNVKAKKMNIPIITEEEFENLIKSGRNPISFS